MYFPVWVISTSPVGDSGRTRGPKDHISALWLHPPRAKHEGDIDRLGTTSTLGFHQSLWPLARSSAQVLGF